MSESLGVLRFILCETCTAAHRRFVEGLAVPPVILLMPLRSRAIPPSSPVDEPLLLEETDHISEETA
jgi:hypothetical protein